MGRCLVARPQMMGAAVGGFVVGVAEAGAPVCEVGADEEGAGWVGEVGGEEVSVGAFGGWGGVADEDGDDGGEGGDVV